MGMMKKAKNKRGIILKIKKIVVKED